VKRASSYYFRVKPSKKLRDARFFKDVERFTRAIRATDYENLDIVPANMSFREFDVFLSRMEVLLIGSSKGTHWVIPKGIHEPGLSATESASHEALEEAGVKGVAIRAAFKTKEL
jgi:8-oxo-dGTP pyrophosphatase MutT (NUDIX family)